MKYIYLIIIFLIFKNLNAQNKVEINFPKNDTIVLEDNGLILPKWQVDFSSIGNYSVKGVYTGIRTEVNYLLNEFFSSKINLSENYNLYNGVGGNFFTTNFSSDFYSLLFNKEKIKPTFYLKNFYNKTTNSFFKPIVNVRKKKQLKIGVGVMNKSVRDQLLIFESYYLGAYDYINKMNFVDNHFDEDDLEFDYDGFINEFQDLKYFNQYSLRLGLNYSINKDYRFFLKENQIKKKIFNEFYCSMLIGVSQNAKYDNKNQNFDIENNFKGRIEYKRVGWSLGAKHTFKSININYELGILPNYIFTNSFYQELLLFKEFNFYDKIENGFLPGSNYLHRNQRRLYAQFSIGYTFGQKIKPSK